MFEVAEVAGLYPAHLTRKPFQVHSFRARQQFQIKRVGIATLLSTSRQLGSRRADIRLARGFRIAKLRHRFAQQIAEQQINERVAAATAAACNDVRRHFDAGFRQRIWLAEIILFAAINNFY